MFCVLFFLIVFSALGGTSSPYDIDEDEVEIEQKKLLILGGAGYMGQFALSQILKYKKKKVFSHITIGDIDVKKGEELIEKHNNPDMTFESVDVSDHDSLVGLMKKSDIVISTVGPYFDFGEMIVRAAIDARKPLFDINNELEPTMKILEELDNEARMNRVGIFMGFGFTPGLTNFLTKVGLEEFDKEYPVDVDISYVTSSGDVSGLGSVLHMFYLFRHTNYWESDHRHVEFPDPIGEVEVMEIPHPETYTLKMNMKGTNLGKVAFRGGILPEWNGGFANALNQLGILGGRSRDGTIGKWVNDLKFIFELGGGIRSGSCRVDFQGMKNGVSQSLTYHCGAVPMGELAGYPVAIAAYLYATGKIDNNQFGVLTPETQDPYIFFEEFKEAGVKIAIEDFGELKEHEILPYQFFNSKNIFLILCIVPPIAMICSGGMGCIIGLVVFIYLRQKLMKKKND